MPRPAVVRWGVLEEKSFHNSQRLVVIKLSRDFSHILHNILLVRSIMAIGATETSNRAVENRTNLPIHSQSFQFL